jgi:predicted MFS family arabinose efflux permease
MAQWKQLRIMFLAVTLGGVLFVLVKVFLMKSIDKPKSEQPRQESNIYIAMLKTTFA